MGASPGSQRRGAAETGGGRQPWPCCGGLAGPSHTTWPSATLLPPASHLGASTDSVLLGPDPGAMALQELATRLLSHGDLYAIKRCGLWSPTPTPTWGPSGKLQEPWKSKGPQSGLWNGPRCTAPSRWRGRGGRAWHREVWG